jgi:hypothetical protein
MARISSELIEKTILVFKNQTGRKMSKEDARQAIENISGFFQVLQEWADAEDKGWCDERPDSPAGSEGVE